MKGHRVLFRTEAGENAGLGHVVRSIQLACKLQRLGLGLSGFWINDFPPAKEFIRSRLGPVRVFWESDHSSIRSTLIPTEADGLVIDQAGDFSLRCRELRKTNPQLITAALDPPVLDSKAYDLIITLFPHGTEEHRDYDPSRHSLGLEYAILRPGFAPDGPPTPPSETVEDVLVSCGGTDPSLFTLKIMSAFSRADAPRLRLHVVVGPGFGHRSAIQRMVSSAKQEILLYHDVDDMCTLMGACDLGVVSSGTTLMEMCALGKPSLSFAHNAAEERFAGHFHKMGATRFLGVAAEIDELTILTELSDISQDPSLRKSMHRQARLLIDGKGAQRTAAAISTLLAGVNNG